MQLFGYQPFELRNNIANLKAAESPYIILSDFSTMHSRAAMERYTLQRPFFEYLEAHYNHDVARFENFQTLLGIDSKAGSLIPHDWLHQSPRITILLRRDEDAGSRVEPRPGASPRPTRDVGPS